MTYGENLGWCKPLKNVENNIIIIVCENKIIRAMINGIETETTPENIKEIAKKINSDYEIYSGWDDLHIILDGDLIELGCTECPYFKECDAMETENN